jgi:hypothetical protein
MLTFVLAKYSSPERDLPLYEHHVFGRPSTAR